MKTAKKFEIPFLLLVSLITYYLQSLAWPITLGRDGGNYLLYYLDILSNDPVYHLIMVMRTPIAPLLYGSLLSIGGAALTEFAMGIIYSGAVLGIYLIGKMWSNKLAILSALLVNFYPAYGALYHTISSEAPLAFFFIVWCLYFLVTMNNPSAKKFIGLGLIAFLLILTRPTFIAFVLYAIVPFLLFDKSLRKKAAYSLSFIGTFIPLVLLWCTYNYVRYDDFTIARTNNAHLPLYRVFIINHTVSPDNGIASAKLADDVENYLLSKEPYRSYGITREVFFSKGTLRMWGDLIALSDEIYGWDSDYRLLRRVGLEAVYRHPKEYIFSVIKSFGGILLKSYSQLVSTRILDVNNVQQPLDSQGLPIPTEDDLIPRSYYLGGSSPTGKLKPDPNSLEYKILDPVMQYKADELNSRLRLFQNMLPPRNGIDIVANVLNTVSFWYLPPVLWLLFGVIGLILRPDVQNRALAFICLVCLGILFYTILGVPSVIAMRVPFDPLFIFFGVIGIKEIVLKLKTMRRFGVISRTSLC